MCLRIEVAAAGTCEGPPPHWFESLNFKILYKVSDRSRPPGRFLPNAKLCGQRHYRNRPTGWYHGLAAGSL